MEFIKKITLIAIVFATSVTLFGQKQKKNSLIVKEVQCEGCLDIKQAEQLLEKNANFQVVETINWIEYPYKPEVRFKIAYCKNQILLKYYVIEETIMAKRTVVNASVYKDSAVEFFFSTEQGDGYYNFEFNCIGTIKASYGEGKKNRALIDPEILKKIKVKSSLGSLPFEEKMGGHQWEIMITIPKECLIHDEDIRLKGLNGKANFYKCGDETAKPHFVTWNPIHTETPNYHQPAYFGNITFE